MWVVIVVWCQQEGLSVEDHTPTVKFEPVKGTQGCACFPEFLQNFSERQILWNLCLAVFHALTLKLPIRTSLPVVPKLPVYVRSGEKCRKFRKTNTTQDGGQKWKKKSFNRSRLPEMKTSDVTYYSLRERWPENISFPQTSYGGIKY